MSAVDAPSQQQQLEGQNQNQNHLPLKRKLDDYDHDQDQDSSNGDADDSAARLRKGKSVIQPEEWMVRDLVRGESSKQSETRTRLQLQFFVRMISGGKTLVLQANLCDTVGMVHHKIESLTGIPISEQRLIYRGKQLQWEQTLEDCGVQNDAGLQLVARMRSTHHPIAWQVINYLVSDICDLCRSYQIRGSIKDRLDMYMELPVDRLNNNKISVASFVSRNDRKWANKKKKKKELVGDFDDDDDDYDNDNDDIDGGAAGEAIKLVDYCKIFMDACAPHAFVMLYVSSDRRNHESADECIRCFVRFLKDIEGKAIERAYCATVVMEFCRLLGKAAVSDDLLFLHCRSTLGTMLEGIELASGPEEVNGGDRTCIAIQDVFPFLKDLGLRLVKGLALTLKSDTCLGPLPRDVSDFSTFLHPVLGFVRKRLTLAAEVRNSEGRVSTLGEEVGNLFNLFNQLLTSMDKCLSRMDICLGIKKEGDPNWGWWSEYLVILKELSSISVLYPGSEHRFWTMMRQYKVAVRGLIVKYAKRTDDYVWLHKHKDILDFESRRHLAMLMFPEVREDYEDLHEMLIDRSQLLAESFEYISNATPSSLHAGLFMEFKNEEATGPGVLREWFCLVCQAIFDSQNALFVACPLDRRRFFPNPASKVDPLHLQYFRFTGRVIALALMHKIQVGVVLDRLFFLQLAGRHVSLEDMRDADPCIYNSCKQILEMDADFVDSDGLGLTFVTEVEELGSRKVVELCSGGKEITVNSKNRKEYVNLIVQHHFVTSISEQVSSFARGFADILSSSIYGRTFFERLEPEDLDWMLHGSGSEICVEDWKTHTECHGYRKCDPQIIWFWEVVAQLNAEQKKTLLFFWTSVKYLPVEGFRGLASRLFIYKSLEPQDHLPSSHTCFYRLCIPPYQSKTIMQDRLRVITQEHVGCSFGTW